MQFDTPDAGRVGTPNPVNLFEAGMLFAGTISRTAVMPLSNLSDDYEESARWIFREYTTTAYSYMLLLLYALYKYSNHIHPGQEKV